MVSVTVGSLPALAHHVARVVAERDEHGRESAPQRVQVQTLGERYVSLLSERRVRALDRASQHATPHAVAVLSRADLSSGTP
jgi:hypothetical protein